MLLVSATPSHRLSQSWRAQVSFFRLKRTRISSVSFITDTITYFCFILGVLRAGLTVFPISTRNSAAAIAHLLLHTNSSHMYISDDANIQRLAREALEGLKGHGKSAELHRMPLFDDLFPPQPSEEQDTDVTLPTTFDREAPALIVHSSGRSRDMRSQESPKNMCSQVPLRFRNRLYGHIVLCSAERSFLVCASYSCSIPCYSLLLGRVWGDMLYWYCSRSTFASNVPWDGDFTIFKYGQ